MHLLPPSRLSLTIRRSTLFLCALLCLAGHTRSAKAQVGIYALGGAERVSGTNIGAATPAGASGSFTAYGVTAGVYTMWAHFAALDLGSDYRATFASSSNGATYGNNMRAAFLGVRAAFQTPLRPLRPYAQFGIGGATTNYGRYSSDSGSAAFGYQFQAGVDYTVAPHFDLRAEYAAGDVLHSSSQLGSANLTLQHFGAGVLVRF